MKIVNLYPNYDGSVDDGQHETFRGKAIVSAVIFPQAHMKVAKTFWQHSGDGISSRRADYCHEAFEDGRLLVGNASVEGANGIFVTVSNKGPRRYRKTDSHSLLPTMQSSSEDISQQSDSVRFVEERFGRNLDVTLASGAKLAIRRRIAGALTANVDLYEALRLSQPVTQMDHIRGCSEDDVYLYPCGMSSIFNIHRVLLACRGQMESVSFGSVTHWRCTCSSA